MKRVANALAALERLSGPVTSHATIAAKPLAIASAGIEDAPTSALFDPRAGGDGWRIDLFDAREPRCREVAATLHAVLAEASSPVHDRRFVVDSWSDRLWAMDLAARRISSLFFEPSVSEAARAKPLYPELALWLGVERCVVAHAAAVCRGDRVVVLLGPGGAGKSTAVTRAMARGWLLIGDDRVVLDVDGGVISGLYRTVHGGDGGDVKRTRTIASEQLCLTPRPIAAVEALWIEPRGARWSMADMMVRWSADSLHRPAPLLRHALLAPGLGSRLGHVLRTWAPHVVDREEAAQRLGAP